MWCHHHPSHFVKLRIALRAGMCYLTQAQCCLKRQRNKICSIPQKSIGSQISETQVCPSLWIRGQSQVSVQLLIYQPCHIMWILIAYFYTNFSFEGLLQHTVRCWSPFSTVCFYHLSLCYRRLIWQNQTGFLLLKTSLPSQSCTLIT